MGKEVVVINCEEGSDLMAKKTPNCLLINAIINFRLRFSEVVESQRRKKLTVKLRPGKLDG
mgnify:CR=1 FL=1